MNAISVENLGKRYVIGHEQRSDTLRDAMSHGVRGLWKKFRAGASVHRTTSEEFWALRDVSFTVTPGEVVGIIGRNGAGKSTLLKILSRITEPTTGQVRIRGRAASLLEVGTGFHPELTGRENIFLNGAILGMSRAEIRRKFDEIVAFAEVERFLDTPVKRYSSGMYVRLAFAVAAHLEPEILIVDEVLAVGDAEFQRKCMGKMRSVTANEGSTILFVSHNLAALQTLCRRALYLQRGRVAGLGEMDAQITHYTRDVMAESQRGAPGRRKIGDVLALDELAFSPNSPAAGEPVAFRLVLSAQEPVTFNDLCLFLHSSMGVRVALLDLRRAAGSHRVAPGAPLTIEGQIEKMNLVEGDYFAGLYLNSNVYRGDLLDLAAVSVQRSRQPRPVAPYPAHDRGFVELDYRFDVSTARPEPNPARAR